MAITYLPEKFLPSKRQVKKLANKNLSINKAVLSSISNNTVIRKKDLEKTALKVLKKFKQKVNVLTDFEDYTKKEAVGEVLSEQELMVQRVQNAIVYEQSQSIKKSYEGTQFEWLPSDANEPDPEHQLRYGQVYTIGEDELPGERYGCRCGMRILTDDKELVLD